MMSPEIKDWITVIKDTIVGIAALVTMAVAIYGLRTWKRDLVGKEVYVAAKALVRESHLAAKAARKLRRPIQQHERRAFCKIESNNLTESEAWRISEAEAYEARKESFSKEIDRYDSAKLDLRVLVGSKIYEGFFPFGATLTECINFVNEYIDLIQNYSIVLTENSPEVLEAQQKLYPSENSDDELSQKLGDTREAGESSLLAYLHRNSIYG